MIVKFKDFKQEVDTLIDKENIPLEDAIQVVVKRYKEQMKETDDEVLRVEVDETCKCQ